MRQYLEVKDRYPAAIVFFRLGDFYEMFFEDAVLAARLLDLTLTTRDKGKDDAVPMCGVPHHSARGYIARLTEDGQIHLPGECGKVVREFLAHPLHQSPLGADPSCRRRCFEAFQGRLALCLDALQHPAHIGQPHVGSV